MEFKHFTHTHGLLFHHMSQGSKIHCSGCKSPSLENAYVCWQCNYFLHEQCFRAPRSLKHPSHPHHPLTLAPFPTYSSGSFLCKHCNLDGKGFSYSCAECEFDIHVHCACNSNPPRPQNPTYPFHIQNNVFPSDPHNQTSNDVQSYPPPQPPQVTSFPPNPNNPLPNFSHPIPNQTQNYARPSNQNNHNPMFSQPNPSFVSVPQTNPNNTPIWRNQYVAAPADIIVDTATLNHAPNGRIPSQTQIYTNAYAPNQNNLIPGFPNSSPPNPTIPNQTQSYNIPHTNTYPPNQNNHIPPPQPPPQTYATTTNPPPPSPPPISQPTPVQFPQTDNLQSRSPTITKHFSHPHAMKAMEIEPKNAKLCSACECQLSGPAYCCTELHCSFNLHKTCFNSPTGIWHKSHPDHPLTLHASPGYNDGFTCDACRKYGKAFVYNCGTCSYDIHINCIMWPETMARSDHKHNLTLHYSSPYAGANQDTTFTCDVCMNSVDKMGWMYYCEECDFGTHLECVANEVKKVRAKTEQELLRELEEVRLYALQMKIEAKGRKAALKLLDDSDSD